MDTLAHFSFHAQTHIDECMKIAAMVQWLLDSQGWKQERLAEELSVSQPTVNRWLSGSEPRGPTYNRLIALYNDKRHGSEKPDLSVTREVELKGQIGAGGEIEAVDAGHSGTVEAPADSHPETVAGEVSGLSMMPVYEQGTLLYWSQQLPPDAMVNRRCVVQLGDGRIMVKMLRPGSAPNLWTLSSVNPAYADIVDVPVEWAAKIDWIKPA